MTQPTGRKQRSNLELIQGLLKIRDKRKVLQRFNLNSAQALYWAKKTRRNLILKARQKGISKIIDADQLIDCIRKPTNAVVISHEKEATKRLFASVRGFIDDLETKPAISIDSKTEIQFPKSGSSYFIGTAGQKSFGRGDTIQRAHLSEAAFYDDLASIMNGVGEAAEYGQIDIETTPNGRGEFHDMWQKAKNGKSAYTPIFIPWFIDGEYSSDNLTEKERNGLSASVREMFDMPEADFIASLDEEEKRLVAKVAEEYGIVLTTGQLKWRRYKIWDKGLMFFQEYPEDDVSCFLQSGRTVFSQIIREPNRKIPLDNLGAWRAKDEEKEALKRRILYGGVDCAEGLPDGDRHVFSVIDVMTWENKAAVIYELASNDPIDVFWLKVAKICRTFNIHLGIEKNGVGVAHVQKAKELRLRFLEYDTTGSNRPTMITELEEAYRKAELIETYIEAEEELRDMIYNANNKAEARKGKHDDRVMSRSIAWQLRKRPVPGVTLL